VSSANPIFDAYVIVDWSAAAVPRTGADSVWIGIAERQEAQDTALRLLNPPTRAEAMEVLADVLSDMVARDRVVLAGFDFAFGYPAGFARSLRPADGTWRGVWKEIGARVRDGGDNANNRFEVASAFNQAISGGAFPFWGCPGSSAGAALGMTRPEGYGEATFREYRLADRAAKGPQPVWKLAYNGSVGSQTLLGIAALQRLRHHPWIEAAARIWPFETGLSPLRRPEGQDWRVLFAEVYPSAFPIAHSEDVKDARQVRGTLDHLARLDAGGALSPLFAGPASLGEAERRLVEREEAWILGIETMTKASASAPVAGPRSYDYVRDPAEIYRLSFAAIRAEADLAALPADLEAVAVRMIHACGDPRIIADFAFSDGAAAAGRAALAQGAPILVDTEMVAAGIIRSKLPAHNRVICTLGEPGVAEDAEAMATTRSAAAIDRWRPHLDGAVVAIGNAPTALFRLLELIDQGAPRPALILGLPVGFVGAAESKEALIAHPAGLPHIALRGRRGGSAFAAAAVNALAGSAANGAGS
jgi:precorrin-8X/cobalt-precorrin-8 methylmutase